MTNDDGLVGTDQIILCKDCAFWGEPHPEYGELKECTQHPNMWAPHTYYDCIYTKTNFGCIDARRKT